LECCVAVFAIFKDRATVTFLNLGQKMGQGKDDGNAYSILLLKTGEKKIAWKTKS
jgi:hypothetical protein